MVPAQIIASRLVMKRSAIYNFKSHFITLNLEHRALTRATACLLSFVLPLSLQKTKPSTTDFSRPLPGHFDNIQTSNDGTSQQLTALDRIQLSNYVTRFVKTKMSYLLCQSDGIHRMVNSFLPFVDECLFVDSIDVQINVRRRQVLPVAVEGGKQRKVVLGCVLASL